MPFGLSNATATFQNMMNHIFRDLLDLGLIVYLDDILIYAETEDEHDCIVTKVLKCLAENGLAISQDKCFWSTT
jgi:predicted regulator of amino acid metabolism with ACT domain